MAARKMATEFELENVLVDAQRRVLGYVDSVSISGLICEISGWAVDEGGRPLWPMGMRLGEHVVHEIDQLRQSRPDVVQVYPQASPECGFHLALSLLNLQNADASSADAALILDAQDAQCELAISNWPIDSFKASMSSYPRIPDEPHMPAEGSARLRELLQDSQGYLEYGTGGSTMLASRMGVPHIVGVESDRTWLEAVRRQVNRSGAGGALELMYVDIGPTGEWGFPVSDIGWRQYAEYPTAPWLNKGTRDKVNLILIDGRFRVACFLASLLFARPGTRILFDDYFDRPYYAGVEAFVQPVARHDRIAEFVVPAQIEREKATAVLLRSISDVR